jgi:hypothetical protein
LFSIVAENGNVINEELDWFTNYLDREKSNEESTVVKMKILKERIKDKNKCLEKEFLANAMPAQQCKQIAILSFEMS